MVHFSVRQNNPRISLATVYRQLENLTNEGLVKKFVVPGEPDHYDATTIEHIHAYCSECGRIFDVDIKLSKLLKHQLEDSGKLKVDDYQLIASGVCNKCQKIKQRRNYA
jgi:Fur family peroxide stress response transcriptional regulator